MKNELSSKEATTGESVLRKKVIREEMVPCWLENGNIHQQEEKSHLFWRKSEMPGSMS